MQKRKNVTTSSSSVKPPIYVLGSHITQFGELWDRSLESLLKEATENACANADTHPAKIDAIFVANMAAGQFEGQLQLGALVSHFFPHCPPSTRVEAACASGGVALVQAQLALLSGLYKTVLVVGAEKMTDAAAEVTSILSAAAHHSDEYGSTFPGLYALLAKAHQQQYGTPRRALSMIAAKNHAHAVGNPAAQFRRRITPQAVEASQLVADPLTLLDCSPISDGAAAVVLSTVAPSIKTQKKSCPVTLVGFGQGQDSLQLSQRSSLTTLSSTRSAARQAFQMAGLTPSEVEVAEVHDCFTIAELLAMEDLGFCQPGTASDAVLHEETAAYNTARSGKLPIVNHSGGLKACGHPVGATGVKQVAYLSQLLASGAYNTALAHNVGGSGATAVVTLLATETKQNASTDSTKKRKKSL